MINSHQKFMQLALKEAVRASEEDEVPVGAVVVYKDRVIGKSYNQVERLKDPTAHAEMIAITQASHFLNCKWLNDCSVYVTIEPCPMCAGALVLARVKNVIFAAADLKSGACGSVVDITNSKELNHRIKITKGILEQEARDLLQEFFRKKRKAKT
ncbi:MAG: tRNA adenosine(34) deaminase TadA [Candidatus Gygaella obscura]|nr:tRNA adenosine(34) deaminase TadA [Candidatus Gygaella obscura]